MGASLLHLIKSHALLNASWSVGLWVEPLPPSLVLMIDTTIS